MRIPRATGIVTLALLMLVTAAAPAAAAPPGWKVAGTMLTGTTALASTAHVVEAFKFTSSAATIECSGSAINGIGGEVKASSGGAISSLTFTSCKPTSALCSLQRSEIVLLPLSVEAATEHTLAVRLLLKPKTGTTLATVKFEGSSCALSGVEPLAGKVTAKLTAGQDENTAQALLVHTPEGEVKLGSSAATMTGEASLLKLKSAQAWSFLGETHAYSNLEGLGGVNPGAPNVPHCSCGDPVDNASGNFTESHTDLSIGGRGPGLVLTRAYNAQAAVTAKEAGPFGYGWSDTYSAHLVEEGGVATVYQGNGSAVAFNVSEGKYTPGSWVEATLSKSGSNYIYTLPAQTKLEFNSSGQLVKETERNGNSVTLAYNGSNQLETVTDGDSRKLTFKYNGGGQVESVEDPMKHVVKYTYEGSELKTVTLPGETSANWTYEYNGEHELTKITDGRSGVTENTYNASHQATKQVDPLKHEREWTYTKLSEGTETKILEPNGSETVETFNAEGEPTKVTRANGTGIAATTEYKYNTSLDRTSEKNPDGFTTEFGYDAANNKTSEKDPNGDEQKWKYDGTHDIETETTPDGEETKISRNADGDPEVIERAAPGGKTQKTKYKYDTEGDLTEETNPLEGVTKYTYDGAGDRESETNPDSDKRTWEYDKDSQVVAEVSPRGNETGAEPSKFTTKTERDAQERPIKVTDPLSHVAEYKYDADGNLESEKDGDGNTTKYTYDADNERTKVETAAATTSETGYNSEGQVTSRTDGDSHKWKYERNALGEVTEEINPRTQTTKKEYDKAGNLTSVEDPEKRTTTYKYYEDNRLKEASYSSGSPHAATYEYNKDGKVTKMTDGTGETTNKYDELDRLTESTDGHGDVVKYEYNLDNQPTVITYPNKKSVERVYDKDGRLEKVIDWKSNETKFSYNEDAELAATTFPAATKDEDTYKYNDADQMTEVKMAKSAETLGTLAYERDSDGFVKKTTITVLPGETPTEDTYDKASRLTKSGTTEYEYDGANNAKKLGTVSFTYNAADELESGTGLTYTYNEEGQRTKSEPTGGPATKYGYDQAGNLTSVEREEKGPTPKIEDSYGYNGENLRTSQDISGTTTHLIWDTAERLPLLLSDETNSYIYGPEGMPIEQIATGGGEEVLYLHHDQQGSTRLLTNSSGSEAASYAYTPYGVATKSNSASTPLLYDGQYTSSDTGLVYMRARVYDPQTAQFLSIDPALLTTVEAYVYAKNNPLDNTDPTGDYSEEPSSPAEVQQPPAPQNQPPLPLPPLPLPPPQRPQPRRLPRAAVERVGIAGTVTLIAGLALPGPLPITTSGALWAMQGAAIEQRLIEERRLSAGSAAAVGLLGGLMLPATAPIPQVGAIYTGWCGPLPPLP